MNNKELYLKKVQTELDEWKAQIELFRAKAASATADAKISMNKDIKVLEEKVADGKAKLSELSKSSESTYDAMKRTFETKWEIIKTSVVDMSKKLSA